MAATRKAVFPVKVGTIGKTASNNQANSTLSPVFFQTYLSTIAFLSDAAAWWDYFPCLAILFIREVAR